MDHLKNILLGVGEVLTAFGTAPAYKYPKTGDRSVDNQALRKNITTVAGDMRIAATRVVRGAHVEVKDGTTQRQGPTRNCVGS